MQSGAIVEYIEETYDTENKLQLTSLQDKWALRSWLYFQVSGQGPYFGQVPFFRIIFGQVRTASGVSASHADISQPVSPNVIERFEKEAKRVTGVIDAHLKKTGGKYLVGDKVTYADIAFIPWYYNLKTYVVPGWNYEEELPHFTSWINSLLELPSVKTIYGREEFQRHH